MRTYLVVALGGVLGALGRWGVSVGVPHEPGAWPWATVTVNLTGCLVIGLLLAVLLARFPDHPWLRPLLATGVCGGYTTFSTFAVDGVQLADAGRWGLGAIYVLVSAGGGLLAVVLGLVIGRRAVGARASVRTEVEAGTDRS